MSSTSSLVDLPRSQVGPNPQHLLITLLGDYWHGRPVPIPSGALVALLGEFGISAASTRSALSRLGRRGVLELVREGRNTSYQISRDFLELGVDRASRLFRFGDPSVVSEPWNGQWTVVTVSTPDGERPERKNLRTLLRSLGFAPMHEGVLVSVHADPATVRDAVAELSVDGVTVFSAELLYPEQPALRRSLVDWPLDRAAEGFGEFIARYGPHVERAERGEIPPAEALVLRIELMDTWRTLVRIDPDLPGELIPADWPRPRAREIFVALYDGLGVLAEARCRQIVGSFDAGLIPLTTYITTDAVLDS